MDLFPTQEIVKVSTEWVKHSDRKVLEVNWDAIKDHLCFSAKLNFFSIWKRRIQKDNLNDDLKLTPPLSG